MNRLNQEFANFRACCDEAPVGAFEDCKRIRDFIGDIADDLLRRARSELNIPATGNDNMHNVEATIYAYLKGCDTDQGRYHAAEGFGVHVHGPARERILANMKRDIAFVQSATLDGGK